MSRKPIARSPDLQRLQNEGYDIELRATGSLLLVRDVPYVNDKRQVLRGTLVLKLVLAGDEASKPTDHTARWIGEHPCHANGNRIGAFLNSSNAEEMGDGVRVDHVFSAKADYRDYHHQETTYIGHIEAEAQKIEPDASARTSSPRRRRMASSSTPTRLQPAPASPPSTRASLRRSSASSASHCRWQFALSRVIGIVCNARVLKGTRSSSWRMSQRVLVRASNCGVPAVDHEGNAPLSQTRAKQRLSPSPNAWLRIAPKQDKRVLQCVGGRAAPDAHKASTPQRRRAPYQ